MSLYQCEHCGCCENTACGHFWARADVSGFDWTGPMRDAFSQFMVDQNYGTFTTRELLLPCWQRAWQAAEAAALERAAQICEEWHGTANAQTAVAIRALAAPVEREGDKS